MIEFACPGCGAKLGVEDIYAGKSGSCPDCSAPFTAPHPSDQPVRAVLIEPAATHREHPFVTWLAPRHGPITYYSGLVGIIVGFLVLLLSFGSALVMTLGLIAMAAGFVNVFIYFERQRKNRRPGSED